MRGWIRGGWMAVIWLTLCFRCWKTGRKNLSATPKSSATHWRITLETPHCEYACNNININNSIPLWHLAAIKITWLLVGYVVGFIDERHGPCLLKRIQTFETDCLRKLLHISYSVHKTNGWVLYKISVLVGPQEPFLATVKRWKLAWIGRVIRHDSLSKSIIQGDGWATLWSAEEMLDGQGQRIDVPVYELLTRAFCREDWKRLFAESSFMSPRGPSQSKDWTELMDFVWKSQPWKIIEILWSRFVYADSNSDGMLLAGFNCDICIFIHSNFQVLVFFLSLFFSPFLLSCLFRLLILCVCVFMWF